MAKRKATVAGQLSLFNTRQYERSYSNYDIEDGYEVEELWPKVVSESSLPLVTPVSESIVQDNDSLTSQDNDSLTTNPCGVIGKYRAGGNTRGNAEYWRFSYRVGKRVKHVHIPGGCCTNPIALGRADRVREAIGRGATVEQVLKLVQNL